MFTVAALYKFTPFDDPVVLKAALLQRCLDEGVRGTLLLASEGINGTIAGTREGIVAVLSAVRALPGCADIEWKESYSAEMPFNRMKVRLKREIVTMGRTDVDPTTAVGRYVEPADWNALIDAPDVAVIDTRNDYEVALGTFDGAVDPHTASFGEFPEWWEKHKDRFAGKRIAMFCTGGIRCEKSTNYLLGQGVDEVFHLKGGILKYLEEVPAHESRWEGQCFVFDKRVSVGHGLKVGPHVLCYACRMPLVPEDLKRADYEAGVSCRHCIDTHSDGDRERFRERQRQLAEDRPMRKAQEG